MPKGTPKNPKKTAEKLGKITEKLSFEEIHRYKTKLIDLFDRSEVKTVSEGARKLGLSPTRVRDWAKSDENFRNQIREGEKVLADGLIKELLELDPNTKMPIVVAKIFLIKGFRPEFRDNFKIVEFQDRRALEILEKLRQLGIQPKVKELPAPKEAENPLVGTVERVNYAERSTN